MPVRRRSPMWMRDMPSLALHRLGGKLLNDDKAQGLTTRQEALWEAVTSELEYRNRRRIIADRCMCLLCVGPFCDGGPEPAELRAAVHADRDR